MSSQPFYVVENTTRLLQYHFKPTVVIINAGYFGLVYCLKVQLCSNLISVLRARKMSLFVGQVREIVVTSLDCMRLPSLARESCHWKEALLIWVQVRPVLPFFGTCSVQCQEVSRQQVVIQFTRLINHFYRLNDAKLFTTLGYFLMTWTYHSTYVINTFH